MKLWLRFVLSRPALTLSLLLFITALLAPGVAKLTFNNRLEAFMPKKDPDFIQNQKTKEIYGDNSRYFVIALSHQKMKEARFFSLANDFTKDIEAFSTGDAKSLEKAFSACKALFAGQEVSQKELLEASASSPLFTRLLSRKLKGAKDPLPLGEKEKVFQRVRQSLDLMAQGPIQRVLSPLSAADIHAVGDEIFTGPLVETGDDGKRRLPETKGEIQKFYTRLSATPAFKHGIYAENKRGEISDFGIVATFARAPRVDLISREVMEICQNQPKELRITAQGSPVINVSFNNHMQKDLKRFLPLVMLVMSLTFLFNFRSRQGLLLPLGSLLTSTCWIMGTMGHLGLAITPLGIALPTLMVSVGSSYAIHIYNQYLAMEKKGQKDLLGAMTQIAPTVLFAGLTTFIAFATLSSSRLSAVREWGLLSALGVVYSMVVASSLIPSVLALCPQKKKPKKKTGLQPVERAVTLFARLSLFHPKKVVATTLCIVFICVLGIFRMEVESDFLAYFKKNDPVRTSASVIDEKFKGRWGFNLLIDSGKDEGILDPAFLKEVEKIRQALNSPEKRAWSIGRTDAITDFFKLMHRAMNRDDPFFYRLPETRQELLDYLEIYGGADENDDGRPDDFEPFFDPDLRVANIVCRFTEEEGQPVGTARMGRIMEAIEAWAGQSLPKGASARITGFPKIDVKITRYITWGQLSSLGLSLGVILFVVLARFRSLHAALLALIPMGTATLINFGVMGWFKINLDILTSIIASMTVGIGVDDTIHFLNTYRHKIRQERLEMKTAIAQTLTLSGQAITCTSSALVAGFLVLASSQFIAVVLFGCLMGLTMVATTLGALLVLPSLVHLTGYAPEKEPAASFDTDKTDALIALCKKMGAPPKRREEKVSHLKGQSEEEYQKEQAAWLEKVKKRRATLE